MKFTFSILTICIMLLSCGKSPSENISLWECKTAQFLDSSTIANIITGSWLWTKQLCGDGNSKIKAADKNVKVTFNSNGTFTVLENLSVISQGNWSLKIVDNNAWGLDLTLPSEYLYGRILFCNNQVMFNDSYRDGCDNLFVKE